MAKPFTVASTDGASSSTSTPHRRRHRQDSSSKPRRRRRKVAVTAAHSLAPSSTLLSLLSLVVSASVAEGSPAPPAFLCPSIAASPTRSKRRSKRTVSTTAATTTPTAQAKTTVPRAIVRNIADKYEKGEDGIWRRVESYTLYGVCPGCSKTAVSAIDEQISRPNDTSSTVPITSTDPTPTPTTAVLDYNLEETMPDKLPPGWACLFWRKTVRRRYRADVEMKGKSRRRNRELSAEEAKELIAEKESRTKQKVWARATARWRENARYTARQRRGKRASVRSRATRSSTSLDNHREGLASGRSSPIRSVSSAAPSRSVSRRGSTTSFQHDSVMDTSPSPQEDAVPTISVCPPPVPPHSSPPAYQQKDLKSDRSSEALYANDEPTSTSLLIRSRRPSHSSFLATSESESGDISSIPAAHVATDDKAVLARLAELASAPPSDGLSAEELAGEVPQVSAPEWRDEEMEEFIAQEGGAEAADSSTPPTAASASPFPPPPSKGSLHAPNFYDYPYAFEEMEIVGMEPELGPSAPPFEETQSGSLGVEEGDMCLVPSAPPMLDDDDLYVNDLSPSAPEMQSLGEACDGEEQAGQPSPTGAGHRPDDNSDSASEYANEGPALPLYRP
ncbi:hypothetical protein D9611_005110 [Ephemerocybe angulata]|uniref:Uncharacterized protein n=1 Tax=Ephemerocybe angulata TaxID=980116 RepID=A0A8H5C1Z1_9AGAR|nr:hypothetical protein D9611_005110 [Tulosesus angulatus]